MVFTYLSLIGDEFNYSFVFKLYFILMLYRNLKIKKKKKKKNTFMVKQFPHIYIKTPTHTSFC